MQAQGGVTTEGGVQVREQQARAFGGTVGVALMPEQRVRSLMRGGPDPVSSPYGLPADEPARVLVGDPRQSPLRLLRIAAKPTSVTCLLIRRPVDDQR
jgi:hypothetical protein